MKKLALFLIFGATLASAQTTVVVPAPDGKTIISKDNIWSCIQPGNSNVIYANGILSVNGTPVTLLSLTQLNLTGGTVYPDGDYLATFKGGSLTWKPYVPPVPSGGTSVPGKSFMLPVPALAGWAQGWYQVKGAVLAAGQIIFATPTFTGQPPASMLYLTDTVWADSTGQVWIRIGNGTGNAFPAMNWSITVK